MNRPTGEIRRGRKFDQVVEGARLVFLRDGFDGANVDDIAREAGVSKATLYSYFPDKRILFMEMATRECRRQAEEHAATADFNQPPDVVLKAAAQRLILFMLSDLGKKVYRLCVAEADRFPELARRFHESGALLVRQRLTDYLQIAHARGEVSIDDMDLAADQFSSLCKALIFPDCLLGVMETMTEAQVDRVATGAVQTFLARYGTATSQG